MAAHFAVGVGGIPRNGFYAMAEKDRKNKKGAETTGLPRLNQTEE